MLLRDIHSKLIDQYDCKEVCASSPSQVNAGDRARPRSQDGVPLQQEAVPLSLPQLNRLFEASFALKFIGSLRAEQLSLRSQQLVVTTVEESVLRMEMAGLDPQEEDAPRRVLFFNPMSWLGQIRPHRRDESWSASLCQTFFFTSMGAQIPVIPEKPLVVCGCRKTHKVKTHQVVNSRGQHCKAYYQAFFWVLIDLIVELLGLIVKPFDNQTES
jgi:hypothetical protein